MIFVYIKGTAQPLTPITEGATDHNALMTQHIQLVPPTQMQGPSKKDHQLMVLVHCTSISYQDKGPPALLSKCSLTLMELPLITEYSIYPKINAPPTIVKGIIVFTCMCPVCLC